MSINDSPLYFVPRTWLSKPGQVGAAVEVALKQGYRHIDCAHAYGNEAEIGEALHKCFKEGMVRREEVFITSKLRCRLTGYLISTTPFFTIS